MAPAPAARRCRFTGGPRDRHEGPTNDTRYHRLALMSAVVGSTCQAPAQAAAARRDTASAAARPSAPRQRSRALPAPHAWAPLLLPHTRLQGQGKESGREGGVQTLVRCCAGCGSCLRQATQPAALTGTLTAFVVDHSHNSGSTQTPPCMCPVRKTACVRQRWRTPAPPSVTCHRLPHSSGTNIHNC